MGNILFVMTCRVQAVNAGCGMNTTHRTDPQVHFWWPACGHDTLEKQKFEQLVVCPRTILGQSDSIAIGRKAAQDQSTLIYL